MKVLVFGPSGSGKTYVSNALREMGIPAFDADRVIGLSSWYNKHGNKISEPMTAEEAINEQYAFLWSRNFLSNFLRQHNDIFIFGGSGNIFDLIDLFDSVYFLKIDSQVQRERIQNSNNRNKELDFKNEELVIWGEWLEEKAREKNISFIDGTLSPKEIYSIIST